MSDASTSKLLRILINVDDFFLSIPLINKIVKKVQDIINPKVEKDILNAEESLLPILWLNRIAGMTIFEMPSGHPWPKLSALYAIIRSATIVFMNWYGAVYIKGRDDSYVTLMVQQVIKFVHIGITGILTCLGFFYYKRITEFTKKILLIDETLEMFGMYPEYSITYRRNYKIILIWCIGVILLFIIGTTIHSYFYPLLSEAIFRNILFQIPLILNSTVDITFAVYISILGKRFEKLNALMQLLPTSETEEKPIFSRNNKYQNILRRIHSKDDIKSNHYKNRNNIEFLLTTIRQLHLELCAISREVNKTCGKQVTLQIAGTFLLIMGFLYCCYSYYIEPELVKTKKPLQYAMISLQITFSILIMLYVIRCSVNVSIEARKASQIAHEIRVSQPPNKVIDEIHQFTLQTLQHPLYFTGAGLFILDFHFVTGFVGSMITNLMILIQNQPKIEEAVNEALIASYNSTDLVYLKVFSF